MSPPRPKLLGTTELQDTIGQGGMAEVMRGFQEALNRPVAVKALLPERKDDEEAVERLRREALALASLHHENIPSVYDLVEKYGRQYVIMEYVDGVDLAAVLESGPVPLDVSLLIGSELAGALEHAHFRKVLHRDIKPSNVMLSRTGQVILTDFGIAKDQTLDDMTRQGFVVGTLNYLSPEQIGGLRADWRSDIYGLGVTLFETLSGQRPHAEGPEQAELLANILGGQLRRLRQVAPTLPRSVEKVVHRCLALDPAKRYQRAAEVRRDLDRLVRAVLKGTRSARVVAFLKDRRLLTGQEMTMIASDEVEAVQAVPRPETVLSSRHFERAEDAPAGSGLARTLMGVLLALLLLAGGLAATWYLAPDWSRQTLAKLSTWGQEQLGVDAKEPPGGDAPPGRRKPHNR